MQIKVISLNLWHGGKLMDGILQFLKQEDADVLLLQEVYDATEAYLPQNYHSIEILNRELDYKFYDFAPAMLDKVHEGKVETGNAVFSKYPITEASARYLYGEYSERDAFDPKQFPTTPRNIEHVVIDVKGTPVNLFNFHGVWDLDGDNYSSQRKHMSDIIIDSVKGKPHVILAGDTNARPTNKAMMAIEDHLKSVFGNELTTTFNMRQKDNPGYATSVVDHMYISSDIAVNNKSCPDVDISDHLPLVVTLEIL